MKRFIAVFIVATIASLTASTSAQASDPIPQPGPKDLTWAQVSELKRNTKLSLEESTASSNRTATQSCAVNMGNIYFRASGNIYDNGAIGLKPILKCTLSMPYLSMSTTLYKEVWFGLQFQAGPVDTSGSWVTQIQSKNIEQRCVSRRATSTFYAITTSSMAFPDGSFNSGSAWQEASLDCLSY